MSEQNEQKVKINGKEYNLGDLSENAKSQLQSLVFADAEVQRLSRQLALAKTARNAYQQALAAELPKH